MSSRRDVLRVLVMAGAGVLAAPVVMGCTRKDDAVAEDGAPGGVAATTTAGSDGAGCGIPTGAESDASGCTASAGGDTTDTGSAGGAGSGDGRAPEGARGDETKDNVVKIELTHDVICPWCRIGHHRLKQAIAAAQRPVEVVYHPFLLDPDVPPEGVDLRQRLAEKYGATSLDGMFDRVTQIGKADGLTFDFAKATRTPNTVAAHTLIEAAPANAKQGLLDRIHAAYFERGEDIGTEPVLLAQWEAAGLERGVGEKALADQALRQRVRDTALAQSRSGVRGVPFFRIGDVTVSGAQSVDVLVDALRRA